MKKTLIIEEKANSDIKATLSKDLYFVRGMAISLVVLGHVIGDRNEGIRQLYAQNILYLDWLYNFIYTFHMPAFFIISGISFEIFSSKNNSYAKFISSRLTRLVIPLICWAPIYFILRSLSGAVNFSFMGLIESVVYPNFIFWFFHTLLFATVLGFIIKKMGSQPIYYAISIVLFILSFFLQGLLQSLCYFNIFYACGIAIAPHMARIRWRLEKMSYSLSFLLLIFFTFIMLVTYHLLGNDHGLVTKFVNGIIGFALMYMLSTWNQPFPMFQLLNRFSQSIADIFVYLGILSMSIYLLHILFSSTTRIILVKFGLIDPVTQFVIGYATSILGPILIYRLLHEKSKFFRYSIGESK